MPPGKNRTKLYEFMVRTCSNDLYRYAYRLCGRHDTAQDLVQETFSEAWKSLDSLREESKARSWLYSILRYRNAHLHRERKRNREYDHDPLEFNDVPDNAGGRDALEELADIDSLQKALDRLDGRFKEPFLMVFLEGLTCAEAAEQLGVPLGTVLSRIHRARAALREYIGGK
jgi:RNA polymerase sigma-70 factor, ECF subfamily